MSDRFFSDARITADRATLAGPEAHHLLHVMRARVGDEVTLFDDSGAEFTAKVVICGRADVELQILDRREVDRELPFELVIGVSLPKGDRQKWLVEKLTELGVTALVPLVTERGVAQPTASALDRLRRSVIEAAKQCGRNRLMKIDEPHTMNDWLQQGTAVSASQTAGDLRPPEPRRLLAHPTGNSLSNIDLVTSSNTCLSVGPEGGFSDGEVAAAIAASGQIVNLGPRILRVETAAIALAAVVAASVRS